MMTKLQYAEQQLRGAALAFALQPPARDAHDSEGRKVNAALLRCARTYARVFAETKPAPTPAPEPETGGKERYR